MLEKEKKSDPGTHFEFWWARLPLLELHLCQPLATSGRAAEAQPYRAVVRGLNVETLRSFCQSSSSSAGG